MFTNTDYDKLQQLMAESPENRVLLEKLLASHEESVASISHEIRNPLTLCTARFSSWNPVTLRLPQTGTGYPCGKM